MAPNPLQQPDIVKRDLVKVKADIATLFRMARKSAGTLKVRVENLLNAKVAGAVNHQVFTYIDGNWTARGGPVVKGYEYDVAAGDLSVGFDLAVDWDVTTSCRVDVTMFYGPTYGVVGAELTAAVTIDGDPHTIVFPDDAGVAFVPSPVATVQILDSGAGPGAPSDLTEVATRSWPVADPHSSGGGDVGGSVSWTFHGGTPHIEANISSVDTDAWPDTRTMYVVWRLTPLP